jgi:hypothetical protein
MAKVYHVKISREAVLIGLTSSQPHRQVASDLDHVSARNFIRLPLVKLRSTGFWHYFVHLGTLNHHRSQKSWLIS